MLDFKCSHVIIPMKLLIFCHFLIVSQARYVSDSAFDMVAAAAEPRPVVVEAPQELQAQVLPLVAEDAQFGEASTKVEKVLRRPIAFSYEKGDQSVEATEEKAAEVVEVDQQPDAIDYYKHVQNIEPAESEEGAGSVDENVDESEKVEENDKIEENEKIEEEKDEEEEKASEDIATIKPFDIHEYENIEATKKDHDNLKAENEDVDDKTAEESAEYGEHYHHQPEDKSNYNKKEEDSDTQDSHHHAAHKKAGGGGGGHKKSGGGGGGGGGHDHKYKKGGGQSHHSGHKAEKGEKGDKGYKGHHHNEKGQKGHHTKEGHEKEYEEKGGQNKKHHHDDGYAAEHHKGEKGHKGSKYKEEGHHSKGHSTKGEHTIHKKDDYNKRQEFFDESYEEDGFEKDGEYFHEDDYKKGGHEKGSFHKGGEEQAHHGKENHYEKGGHYKEGKGHKEAKGHDSHHEHESKTGEKESNAGGKKWAYDKGTGGGGGGGGGHKHGGKYQQADSSNAPIHVAHPIVKHKDNVVQSNIPKLVLEENSSHYTKPNVIYPPLVEPKPKKIIQRRTYDIEDSIEYDASFEPEPKESNTRKESSTKDGLINWSISDLLKEINVNEESDDEYPLDDSAKGKDEVGLYSKYTLGNYNATTISPVATEEVVRTSNPIETLTTAFAIENEPYQKPKHVAITSGNDYVNIEETTQHIEENTDASETVTVPIIKPRGFSMPVVPDTKPILADSIETEEKVSEESRIIKVSSAKKVKSTTMQPIIVKDESEEIRS